MDQRNRPLHDLRISVTDRCNFRCSYCLPKEKYGVAHRFMEKTDYLSFTEIVRLTDCFTNAGVRKIRITGGEPLLRNDISALIQMLSKKSLIEDLAMTTNGYFLENKAIELKRAGLHRITVSLDAYDEKVFSSMSGVNAHELRVLRGIQAAKHAGLSVKLNAVIIKGKNDDQILPLVKFAIQEKIHLRFIEFMDVGNTNDWQKEKVFSYSEMKEFVHQHFPLIPVMKNNRAQVSDDFYILGSNVKIGFISSISKPFCQDCNRARISADGKFHTCLFSAEFCDLKALLRIGCSDGVLLKTIKDIWSLRSDAYSEQRGMIKKYKPEMSYLGG